MNYYDLPDWNVVEKSTQTSHQVPLSLDQKRLSGSRAEIGELLWRNGEVIIGSQSHKVEQNYYTQEEEATLWRNHHIDKKGCRSGEIDQRKEDEKEASVVTMGFSHCDSNQLTNEAKHCNVIDDHEKSSMSKKWKDGTFLATFSTCGRSNENLDRTSKQASTKQNHKRKERYVDEFGWLSEDAEYAVITDQGRNPTSRSNSGKRSRAAEFHNLSERKRRDRINKKMLALQELVPHCNKTDKATMLDEAIDYLKSLQLQVQIMWMGSGMAPMMYSGFEHLMPRMGMAMDNGRQLIPRFPMASSSLASSLENSPAWKYSLQNLFGEQNQMHNINQHFAGSFQSMPLGQTGQVSHRPSATSRTGVQHGKLMHNHQFCD